MTKRNETKRARVWGYTWGDGSRVGMPYESTRKAAALRAADYAAAGDDSARAVLMVEVREGEVVVSVKALLEAFLLEWELTVDAPTALERAVKKVGVR